MGRRTPTGGQGGARLRNLVVGIWIGLVGAGMAFAQLAERDFTLVWWALAAMLLSLGYVLIRGALPARSWHHVELQGRRAWAISLGGRGVVPGVALTCLFLALAVCGVAAKVPAPEGFDSPWPRWLAWAALGAFAALLVLVAVELLRIWLRRPALTIGADMLVLRGNGIDSRLDWRDVTVVSDYRQGPHRWWSVVAIAEPDAQSYDVALSRLILPTDRVPEPRGLHVRLGQVRDPGGLAQLLRDLHRMSPPERQLRIDHELPQG